MKAGTWNILVVDQDELIRTSLALFYEYQGYAVTTVDSAEAGIDAIHSGGYELVICEQDLPDMDAFEFFRTIEKSDPSIMKVLVTDEECDQEFIGLASGTGVHDFIEKPFTAWNLEEVLVKLTDRLESRSA